MKRFWVPVVLALAGLGVLMWHTMQSMPQGPEVISAEVLTATSTSTPEPIIPTRTVEPEPTHTDLPASAEPTATRTPRPSRTPTVTREAALEALAIPSVAPEPTEPIIPTEPAPTVATAESTATPSSPTAEPTTDPTADSAEMPAALPLTISRGERFGVAGGIQLAGPALEAGLPFGSFIDWKFTPQRQFTGIEHWQMIRTGPGGIRNATWEEVGSAVDNQPGAIWVIGNEPDVPWQDGVPPERYAEIYHEAYSFIKGRDPSARIAIAGVSQSTPLRRAYLDRMLNHYEATYGAPMPVDIWNVHAFTLREEADSWGVGIPPGMEGASGTLYEIDDHANVEIWKQNLLDFRAWMAARGYADKPLAVTEFGILLPADYGFPPELVADYMRQTVGWMQSAGGADGYSAEGGRYVQWWFWYSIQDPGLYPTGDLFVPATGELTLAGQAYRGLVLGE